MEKKKAVGYVRVSDDKMLPIDTDKQTIEIKSYLEHLKDYELTDIYTDVGLAREGGNHLVSFERMLQDAESHKFDTIIVKSGNRLSRDTNQLKSVLYHLHDIGIEVVLIDENMRTTDLAFQIQRSLDKVEKNAPKVKVAGYARIGVNSMTCSATEEQYLKDEIAKHPEWEMVNMYVDEGQKGKAKRYGFEEMLKDAEEHKFDILVVKNFRRFCRDAADAIKPLKRLTDAKVAVFFIKDGISTADEQFKIQFQIMCAIEEKQRELKSMIKRKKKD